MFCLDCSYIILKALLNCYLLLEAFSDNSQYLPASTRLGQGLSGLSQPRGIPLLHVVTDFVSVSPNR